STAPVSFVIGKIDDMHDPFAAGEPPQSGCGGRLSGSVSLKFEPFWRRASLGRGLVALAVIGVHATVRCSAEMQSLFEHCVENRREIAGRRVDDLQDLGGRGLLL